MRSSDWSSDVCSSDLRSRLVEQPQSRIAEQQPRQPGERALPARKPAPAFRDRKIEPPGMARNQMRQPRRCRRVEQHLVPRIGQPEKDIVPARAVEQPYFLREIPEMLAQQIVDPRGHTNTVV